MSSNDPGVIVSRTTIPPDKPLSQAPAGDSMAPPSMKVKVLSSFLLSEYVIKIFTL